ncbi:Helix-turn-helix [Devosia crocina]|uniref:Helix-turn-helix n=2 Tax=Devosia crocina TaxID=429728 RepID=A0A1I7NC46_9HYPH|nr:helix-turn-helix transcriptional regulator [Devosia crocina]SFV32232.1 Helix-turn-helix [Devosia crocina]
MIAAQCRAARGLLDWSREELATQAQVAIRTIIDFERGARLPRQSTLEALALAFEEAGVEMIAANRKGAGVRLSHSALPIGHSDLD